MKVKIPVHTTTISISDNISIEVTGNYLFSKVIQRDQNSYLSIIDKVDVFIVDGQYLAISKKMTFMSNKHEPKHVESTFYYTERLKEALELVGHIQYEGEIRRIVDTYEITAGKTPRPGLKLIPRSNLRSV